MNLTTFFYIIFFTFGLLFGSFASVIIWRIKRHEKGIFLGRSHCPKCKHILGFFDLFPIFSYIFSAGKCRYCNKKIGITYLILEVVMGLFFLLSSIYLIDINLVLSGSFYEIIKLIFIFFVSFVIVVFTFYDLLFMEVPDEVLIPSAIFVFILLIITSIWNNLNIFNYFQNFKNITLNIPILNAILGAFIIYTFFYLQIFISGFIYALKANNKKIIIELIIMYFLFPFWINKNEDENEDENNGEEIPFWVGFGDLRIAIFMGLVGGAKIALLGLFLSYLIGSVVGMLILLKERKRNIKIPFGPFLGIGLFIALMFYSEIVSLYLYIL